MARKYSRKHGKSGSKKPLKKTLPVWLRYKPNEVELLITKLSKEGKNSSEIGVVLRDTYGIPDVRLLGQQLDLGLPVVGLVGFLVKDFRNIFLP